MPTPTDSLADAATFLSAQAVEIVTELRDAGRPLAELAHITNTSPDEVDAWAAGREHPTEAQLVSLVCWRDALREALEAASGDDARWRLPPGLWRAGRDRLGGPAVPLAIREAWSLETRIEHDRRRQALVAELTELFALAAASPGGHRGVTAELDDLVDVLRLRACGWRLTAGEVRASAARLIEALSVAGVRPVAVRAVLHDTVRWLDLVVTWPAGGAPPEAVQTGAAAQIAEMLGIAADGVTVRWREALGAADRAEVEERGFDLLPFSSAAASGEAESEHQGSASSSAPSSNPVRPADEGIDAPPPMMEAALKAAIRRHAPLLPWALRVHGVAPIAAWARAREGSPAVEIVAQWFGFDNVPPGCDVQLRQSVADLLGIPRDAVGVYGASDLPLDEVVGLSETGIRLVPPVDPLPEDGQ